MLSHICVQVHFRLLTKTLYVLNCGVHACYTKLLSAALAIDSCALCQNWQVILPLHESPPCWQVLCGWHSWCSRQCCCCCLPAASQMSGMWRVVRTTPLALNPQSGRGSRHAHWSMTSQLHSVWQSCLIDFSPLAHIHEPAMLHGLLTGI